MIRGGVEDLSPSEGMQGGQCEPTVVSPGCCCSEKKAQQGDLGISPSELATEGEERSVRSSRTRSGGEDAGVVVCWVGAVSGLPGLEVLSGVHILVAKHGPAIYSIVSGVVAMHCAVELMVGRFGLWDVCTGVGACG
jgi:hypothetical protein